jgi:hypothetical protein
MRNKGTIDADQTVARVKIGKFEPVTQGKFAHDA